MKLFPFCLSGKLCFDLVRHIFRMNLGDYSCLLIHPVYSPAFYKWPDGVFLLLGFDIGY